MLKVKSYVDSLEAIRYLISTNEHLDVILEGLPQDYETTVALINNHFDPLDIEEVEALLFSHESRLLKYCRFVVDATGNLTQANLASSSTYDTHQGVSGRLPTTIF